MSEMWQVVTEETKPHWLELRDPDGWYTASVKWDGCIHFTRYHNIPNGAPTEGQEHMAIQDSLHICDIDTEIARLQELKSKALAHFGQDWPRL